VEDFKKFADHVRSAAASAIEDNIVGSRIERKLYILFNMIGT
jgi:hypothetical protein